MGLFSIGGNAGMAVGSIFMTFLLGLAGGIHNTMYFAVPGLLVFLLMAKAMPDYIRVNKEHEVQQAKKAADGTSEKMSYFALFLICSISLCVLLFTAVFQHICRCIL